MTHDELLAIIESLRIDIDIHGRTHKSKDGIFIKYSKLIKAIEKELG